MMKSDTIFVVSVVNDTWNNLYSGGAELTDGSGGGGITDAYKMAQIAISEGNDKHAGVALVFQAYLFNLITEMFGPSSLSLRPSKQKRELPLQHMMIKKPL